MGSTGRRARLSLLAFACILAASPAHGQPAKEAGAGVRPSASSSVPSLRVVIDAEPQHLNPLLDPDLWGYRITHDLICEPLLRRKAEPPELPIAPERDARDAHEARELRPARYEPVLAERFRLDPDGHSIELEVRRGVRFHDGRPLTAYDVRMSIEMVRTAGQSALRTQALLADVVRVQIVGKDGIRIDLRRASRRAAILSALSEIDILPASHFTSGRLMYQPWNRRPICTGPYRFVEWRRGHSILLRKNPTYWGPPPAAQELRFRIALDGAQGLSLLRQGEADVLGRVMPRYLDDQVEPAVQRGRWRKLELDADQAVVLLPNGRHPLLGMAMVRRALELVLSREKVRERLVRDVRKGLGTPLRLPPLPPSVFGGPELVETAASGTPTSGLSAEALLDQAQVVRLTPDGPRQHQGRPVRLKLLLPSGTTELAETAKRLGDALAKVGLKLEPEVVDLATFVSRLRRGMFELALCAWSFTGGLEAMELEPLLAYALPQPPPHAVFAGKDEKPLYTELSTALAVLRDGSDPQHLTRTASRLVARWREDAPLYLLYRPRQVVLLGPLVEPQTPPLLGDFINLRSLVRPPPVLQSAMR